MAKPTTKPKTLLVENARKPKSRGGKIASPARRSTKMNPASNSPPAMAKAIVSGEIHG